MCEGNELSTLVSFSTTGSGWNLVEGTQTMRVRRIESSTQMIVKSEYICRRFKVAAA